MGLQRIEFLFESLLGRLAPAGIVEIEIAEAVIRTRLSSFRQDSCASPTARLRGRSKSVPEANTLPKCPNSASPTPY
jgi:hypothetical protein